MKRFVKFLLKSLAAALEASGNYRVLRRLEQQDNFSRATARNQTSNQNKNL